MSPIHVSSLVARHVSPCLAGGVGPSRCFQFICFPLYCSKSFVSHPRFTTQGHVKFFRAEGSFHHHGAFGALCARVFPHPARQACLWTEACCCILGPNGAGETTLMRSAAVGMAQEFHVVVLDMVGHQADLTDHEGTTYIGATSIEAKLQVMEHAPRMILAEFGEPDLAVRAARIYKEAGVAGSARSGLEFLLEAFINSHSGQTVEDARELRCRDFPFCCLVSLSKPPAGWKFPKICLLWCPALQMSPTRLSFLAAILFSWWCPALRMSPIHVSSLVARHVSPCLAGGVGLSGRLQFMSFPL